MGGLREDFFVMAMRQAGIPHQYLKSTTGRKTPDFFIERRGQKIVLEIGGKGKGRSQFKGVEADRKIILTQGSAGLPGRLPLEMMGFLSWQAIRSTAPRIRRATHSLSANARH